MDGFGRWTITIRSTDHDNLREVDESGRKDRPLHGRQTVVISYK